MRELRKLDPKIDDSDADGSFPVSADRIIDCYLDYRDKNILEKGGGIADQDTEIIDAYRAMDKRVAFYIINEQKTAVTALPKYKTARERINKNKVQ